MFRWDVPGHRQHRPHHSGVLLWVRTPREDFRAGVSHCECVRLCVCVCTSVCLYVCTSVRLCFCVSVRLCLYVCASVSVGLYVCASVRLYICVSVRLYVCASASVHLCFCTSVCLCVCTSVCLCVWYRTQFTCCSFLLSWSISCIISLSFSLALFFYRIKWTVYSSLTVVKGMFFFCCCFFKPVLFKHSKPSVFLLSLSAESGVVGDDTAYMFSGTRAQRNFTKCPTSSKMKA